MTNGTSREQAPDVPRGSTVSERLSCDFLLTGASELVTVAASDAPGITFKCM